MIDAHTHVLEVVHRRTRDGPMHARDYRELCRIIGQDAIAMESFWTPIKTRADLDRLIWPDEQDMEERLQYVREYVRAAADLPQAPSSRNRSLTRTRNTLTLPVRGSGVGRLDAQWPQQHGVGA